MNSGCALQLSRLSAISEVPAASWNALGDGNPFLRHEFLSALESTGCVGTATAWEPCHLVVNETRHGLVGAMPHYVKLDSRGEFVFDWGWADAYTRTGRRYYPKLVAAVPFTPATGPRLLVRADVDRDKVAGMLLAGAQNLAHDISASSIHVLFPANADRRLLAESAFAARKSCQFHWTNGGYEDFTDFLSRFSSAKRKKVNRERRRIAEANLRFEHLRGDEPSRNDWDAIYEFYSRTFLLRGRAPYLNRDFFDTLRVSMPESLVVILARVVQQPIAAAICFRSDDALYGRYWGSLADFHSLHFETCYYQGIDYCIRERIRTFEPGTQGEHKISRGFSPTSTWSYHKMLDADFHAAISDYVTRESRHVDEYINELNEHVPYKHANR
jgi:predicted N-acyltransferase